MDFEYFSFIAGYVTTDFLWVVNDQDGGLYRISRGTFQPELMLEAVANPRINYPEFAYITFYDNKLYFFPFFSRGKILIYNINTNEAVRIELEVPEDYGLIVLEEKEKVWLFPHCIGKTLMSYDMVKNEVQYLNSWNNLCNKSNMYISDAVLAYGKIWMAVCNSTKVLEFDSKNCNIQIHNIYGYKLDKIAFDGNTFWFTTINSSDLVNWNCNMASIKKYKLQKQNIQKLTYSKIVCAKNEIICLSKESKELFIANQINNSIEKIKGIPPEFTICKNYDPLISFWGYQIVSDAIWLFPVRSNQLLILNLKGLVIDGYELRIHDFKLLCKQYSSCNNILVERIKGDRYSLKGFLKIFDLHNPKEILDTSEYGTRIWEYIKYR